MSRTPPHQRVFALVLAGLLFVTAIAGGVAVIWQLRQDNKQASLSSQANAADSAKNTNQQNGDKKLEGTQLTDFTPGASVDTLQVIDLKEGTGAEVKSTDTITAHYTGALVKTGVIFQSSLDTGKPFTSPLSGLIQGWQTGIPGMKVGGTRRLIIPAAQAYGSQAQQGIPANSDLVFDIQLVSIP